MEYIANNVANVVPGLRNVKTSRYRTRWTVPIYKLVWYHSARTGKGFQGLIMSHDDHSSLSLSDVENDMSFFNDKLELRYHQKILLISALHFFF